MRVISPSLCICIGRSLPSVKRTVGFRRKSEEGKLLDAPEGLFLSELASWEIYKRKNVFIVKFLKEMDDVT